MSEDGERPTRRRARTQQRLLEAAAEVFAEVGLDAASVEAICDRAGFTRGAFYSNFETKNDLFLQLSRRVADERLAAIRTQLSSPDAACTVTPTNVLDVIERAFEGAPDDRLGVLLMSEIRIHSLRHPELAAAFLVHEQQIRQSVARLVEDVSGEQGLRLRLPAEDAAGVMLAVWEAGAQRAVMAGKPGAHTGDPALARVIELIIEPAPAQVPTPL